MGATDRLVAEKAFHDTQARERAASFLDVDSLRFKSNDYLDHETWIRPAFDQLGEVRGLTVLDFGCGHGMASVVLSKLGAQVTALDLSHDYLCEASRRAFANGANVGFVAADGERLPFTDASFDRIWGNAVLHHLDLERTSAELRRVMKPGAVAVFCEPWGENKLLDWARRSLPYPGKHRTVDEKPLCRDDLSVLSEFFPGITVEGHQLLSMVGRVFGRNRWSGSLAWWDRQLLRLAPTLANYCRYVVITLRSEKPSEVRRKSDHRARDRFSSSGLRPTA